MTFNTHKDSCFFHHLVNCLTFKYNYKISLNIASLRNLPINIQATRLFPTKEAVVRLRLWC